MFFYTAPKGPIDRWGDYVRTSKESQFFLRRPLKENFSFKSIHGQLNLVQRSASSEFESYVTRLLMNPEGAGRIEAEKFSPRKIARTYCK